MEWNPIETAPRDGTVILACNINYVTYSPIAIRWQTYHPNSAGKITWRTLDGWKAEVTHWMPLPEPPKEEL